MLYPTAEEVAAINAALPGEGKVLTDPGLLASAVGRPQASFEGKEVYETLWMKTAALFESLACNHVFLDGNKRTAVIAAIHMLNWNGYDLQLPTQDDVIELALGVVHKRTDLHKTAEFFEDYAVPLDYGDLS